MVEQATVNREDGSSNLPSAAKTMKPEDLLRLSFFAVVSGDQIDSIFTKDWLAHQRASRLGSGWSVESAVFLDGKWVYEYKGNIVVKNTWS